MRKVRRNVPYNGKLTHFQVKQFDAREFNSHNWKPLLERLRKESKDLMEEGRRITSHYKRMEREYEDFEERLQILDNAVSQMEEQTGIPAKAIFDEITTPQHSVSEPSFLDEFMSEVAPAPKQEKSIFDDL